MFIYQGSVIANFLGQNGRQYKIPVYQRNYEWSWEQCDKLFEDVVTAGQRNQLHFCGSIVFKPIAPTKGIIDRMARSLEVFPAWQNPVFAYDKDAIRNAVKLKNDSDIYISTGYSAYDCICFIKALLKKYDLDLEEDFVYSARPSNIGTGINRLAMAQKWCEKQAEAGRIEFDADTCEGRYVRFTTPFLNQAIPTNKDVLSPWRTSNYYFYEITNFKNELYVQLYFYCKGITDEMRTAFLRMAELTDGGKLTQGYRLFFKSTVFANSENDTEEVIMSQLDKCLEEIHNFEAPIQSKWNS